VALPALPPTAAAVADHNRAACPTRTVEADRLTDSRAAATTDLRVVSQADLPSISDHLRSKAAALVDLRRTSRPEADLLHTSSGRSTPADLPAAVRLPSASAALVGP
jgi:hypothetical protein